MSKWPFWLTRWASAASLMGIMPLVWLNMSSSTTNSSTPTTMRVHQELSVPSKAIRVWMIPSISTPNSVPAT